MFLLTVSVVSGLMPNVLFYIQMKNRWV